MVLRAGVKVKSVNVEETALLLEDGETVHADLIVAADGVHVSGEQADSRQGTDAAVHRPSSHCGWQ